MKRFLDDEDRTLVAQGLILLTAGAMLVMTAAVSLGVAVRLFEIARG